MKIMNKLLLGVIAGIAIGLLLAPEKGSETVKNLKKRFKEYNDKASDAADDLVNEGKRVFNRAADKFNDTLG
jgi:gas vesicle protein